MLGRSLRMPRSSKSMRALALVLMLSLSALVLVAVPDSAFAAARACDDDGAVASNRAGRCINGSYLRSRGYITQACFQAVQAPVISRGSCSDTTVLQAERIAQARFLQKLAGAGQAADQIAPNFQWEVRTTRATGSGRADVIQYPNGPGDPATKAVEVWEAKGSWNGASVANPGPAVAQAQEYVDSFKTVNGWSAARVGASHNSYTDAFEIQGAFTCPSGQKRNSRYTVSVPDPGAIIVTALKPDPCDRQENQSKEAAQAAADAAQQAALEESRDADEEGLGSGSEPGFMDSVDVADVASGGTRALQIVRGSRTIAQIWAARSAEICVEMSAIGPRFNSSISELGKACLSAEASRSAAAFLTSTALLEALKNGYLTEEDLARIFGVDLATAAQLVATSQARASGDPHLITLDGLNYDLQSVGEFVLASSPQVGVEVQARFVGVAANLSAVNSLALDLDGLAVELRADASVLIDGAPVTIEDRKGYRLGDGAYIVRDGGQIDVRFPDPERTGAAALTWQPNNGIGLVGLSLPKAAAGSLRGLLGNADSDPMNDLRLRDGTQLRATTPAAYLHDAYADSWRIHDSESLFTYGSGKSTASFTDAAFPQSIITRGDFTPEQRTGAMAVCQRYGVTAGPAFDDCELDVLATGNWAFAVAAAKVRVPSTVAGDAEVDAAGHVGVDFETGIPNNFAATRVGENAGLTSFAGPYTGQEQYRFYVPQLPGHDKATISFDLTVIGAWPRDDAMRLKVDDADVALPVDWSGAATGTLANGAPYRTTRVSATVDHHLVQAAGTLSATGLSGASGTGYAVDNVALDLNLVPAQTFAIDLPQSALVPLAEAAQGIGAGVLESRGAVDNYTFTLAPGSGVLVDWNDSSSTIAWKLISAGGEVVASGTPADGDKTVRGLSGNYRLSIMAKGANPPHRQSYYANLLLVPAAEVFGVDLGVGPVEVSDGKPGPGAGKLETKASVDRYDFTVPQGGSRAVVDFLAGAGGSSYLVWSVQDEQGQVVRAGNRAGGGAAGTRFDQVLPAGNYQLVISPQEEVTGTYSLRMYFPPAEQG